VNQEKRVMATKVVKDNKGASIQIVSFRIGREYFAVPVWQVREIIREVELFDVPGRGENIRGVINLRGEIIPIVRMSVVLGMADVEGETNHRMKRLIIVDVNGGKFGFEVEEVLDVMKVSTQDVQPPPLLSPENSLSGIIIGILHLRGKMIICLDAERIFVNRVSTEDMAAV